MKRASGIFLLGAIAGFACAVASVAPAAPAAQPNAPAEPHVYVGNKRCRACHQKEGASWSSTPMAKAFESLKPGVKRAQKLKAKLDPEKDYTKDKSCLPCHTTGYGKQGGFVDAAATPDMAGVGCESCHGAGGGYAGPMARRDYRKADLVSLGLAPEVTKLQCDACHNERMAVGTVVGSRHFVKQLAFSKTKGIHAHEALTGKH